MTDDVKLGVLRTTVVAAAEEMVSWTPGGSTFKTFVAALVQQRRDARADAAARLLEQELAAAMGEPDGDDREERVWKALHADADTTRHVLESFRAMMEALDPATLPHMAALAGLYHRSKDRDPVWTRAILRLLQDATAQDIRDLDVVLEIVASEFVRMNTRAWFDLRLEIEGNGITVDVLPPGGGPGGSRSFHSGIPKGWRNAYLILTRHNLATYTRPFALVHSPEEHFDLHRFARLMRP